MHLDNKQKLNLLLASLPQGVVCQTSWLIKKGFSNQLLNRYKKSKWLESIGIGAMIRSDDEVEYEGTLYALQKQSGLSIHPGTKTALLHLGKLHYLPLSNAKVFLFGSTGEKLPSWFNHHNWNIETDYFSTSFLPAKLGLVDLDLKTFDIKISGSARAFMECLYLIPKKQEFLECFQIMEGLNNLRPNLVQELLEKCTSIKVKRLFLYMAEKAGHNWFNYLKPNNIDLGSGKRSFTKNGRFISKYQITIPLELDQYEKV